MQKSRNVQYVAAGVQAIPGVTMNVRSNVRLPDSEVGSSWVQERQPYYAARVQPAAKRAMTMPVNTALIFLAVLLLLFGGLIIKKACRRAEISKSISAMESTIKKTKDENQELAVKIAEARDSARISYAASQSLGMIASSGVEAVQVMAPDTRPFEQKTTAQTASSPNTVLSGIVSGSR